MPCILLGTATESTYSRQAQLRGSPPDPTITEGVPRAQEVPDMRSISQCFQAKLQHISRLEQLSAAASIRELDSRKAIALLCGKHMRYFVKATSIDLGRSTSTLGTVSCCSSLCLLDQLVPIDSTEAVTTQEVAQVFTHHHEVQKQNLCLSCILPTAEVSNWMIYSLLSVLMLSNVAGGH